jgi:STE24 endopeptidase
MPTYPDAILAIVTRRRQLWIPLAVLGAGLWITAAVLLYGTSVPDGLKLPAVDPAEHWTPRQLDRAESFEHFLAGDFLLATLAGAVALFVLAVWAPGFARRTGLGPVGAGIIVGMVTLVVIWVVDVPFRLAEQWWYRRHHLSDESYLAWLFAPWGELVLPAILGIFLVAVTMALARWLGRAWWLLGAPVFVAVALFFSFVYPYLDELTYEQRPISAAPGIAQAVPELEERTGAGPTDVRIAHVSEATTLVNAYTAGLGPSQRVVLWDTFLDGRFSTGEIEVVLGHELGHVARAHIWKNLAWFALFALPMTFGVAELTRRRGGMGQPGNVPLAALLLVIFGFALTPAQNGISRRYEAEADWIALQATQDPSSARQLFAGFVQSDLEDPTPSFWEEQLFGSHPSVADRIAMADAWAERNR